MTVAMFLIRKRVTWRMIARIKRTPWPLSRKKDSSTSYDEDSDGEGHLGYLSYLAALQIVREISREILPQNTHHRLAPPPSPLPKKRHLLHHIKKQNTHITTHPLWFSSISPFPNYIISKFSFFAIIILLWPKRTRWFFKKTWRASQDSNQSPLIFPNIPNPPFTSFPISKNEFSVANFHLLLWRKALDSRCTQTQPSSDS